MKKSYIVLFLVSVIIVLMVMCFVIPEGSVLRFPRLCEIFAPAQEKGPSPEELIEQRKEAALAAEQDQFQAFFREDPARFYLPDGDERFFDDVFAALEQAEQEPYRALRRLPDRGRPHHGGHP